MILPNKRKKIISELKRANQRFKGTSQGSSITKRFCRETIKGLDEAVKYKNSRENIESITGVKVRKIGKIIF